jgi:hypothetical protein
VKLIVVFAVAFHVLSIGLLTGIAQEPQVEVERVYVAHFDGAGSMVAWHPREDSFIAGIGASIYFFDPADSEPFRVITIPAQVPEWAVAGLEFLFRS